MQIAATPDATVAALARSLDVPDRSLRRQITDLEEASFLRRRRVGNRNRYDVNLEAVIDLPGRSLTLKEVLDRLN